MFFLTSNHEAGSKDLEITKLQDRNSLVFKP